MENHFIEQCEKDFSEIKRDAFPSWFKNLRQKGFDSFREQGLPTMEQESWRYTSLDRLVHVPYQWKSNSSPSPMRRTPEGAWIGPVQSFMKERPDLLEAHLGRTARSEKYPLVALNTAFLDSGTVVYCPKGTHVKEPISPPRNLIIMEPESEAIVFEHYLGTGTYLTNSVTEVSLAEGSSLDHYRLQEESVSAASLSNTQVTQGRNSRFISNLIMVGGNLSRSEIGSVLKEEGAECTLNGLYSVNGDQHVDNQTTIDHAQPNGTSREIYKGILDGRSTAVFNGGIVVRPNAQKTVARQMNKNLLLSDQAVVNTKPLLEILANDVKCNHGATIGRLDENQIFYLKSRGLGDGEARGLLTFAFANELLSKMKWKPFCLHFQETLFARLALRNPPSLTPVSLTPVSLEGIS